MSLEFANQEKLFDDIAAHAEQDITQGSYDNKSTLLIWRVRGQLYNRELMIVITYDNGAYCDEILVRPNKIEAKRFAKDRFIKEFSVPDAACLLEKVTVSFEPHPYQLWDC